MRIIIKLLVVLLVFSVSACNSSDTNTDHTNPVWSSFLDALESNDAEYLISHSLDTIQCAECNFSNENDTEYFPSDYIFNNPDHIKRLMHFASLGELSFTAYLDEDRLLISYKIDAQMSEEGSYNLIFTFIETEDGYRFKGMVMT